MPDRTIPRVYALPDEPIPAAVGFVDCINRGDVEGLRRRMTADHELVVFDEAPLRGRAENLTAWRGFVT